MLDIDTETQIEALYRLVEIKAGKRVEKFKSTDIKKALDFHKCYIARYKVGLLLEILPKKKVYNWKEKKVDYNFE